MPSLPVTSDRSARPLTEDLVRCSHYPQSPAFLDACDELGLMVWEEAPGWHNVSTMAAWQDAVVRDVRDMVIRDRSRPSVIIWGTRLNECKNFPGLWAATRQAARELDSTRPSSGAMAFHGDRTWNEGVFAGAVPAPGQTAMIASNCERLEVFIGGTQVASAQPATGSPLYGALAHPPFLVRLPKHLPKPAPDLLIRGFVAGQPGAITLTASHPLLGQAEVQVRSAAVKNTSELG